MLTPTRVKAITASRMLITQFCFHMSWALGGLSGSLLGGTFAGDIAGLDFLLTALFLVLSIDAYRANPSPAVLALSILVTGIALMVSSEFMVPIAMTLLVLILPLLNAIPTPKNKRTGETTPDDVTKDSDA